MPLLSLAVTVILKADPAVTGEGAETVKEAAAPGLTLTGADPVTVEETVSVAVTVQEPTVLSVTEKVPTPLVRVELAGRIAELSVEVIRTVPI